MAYFHYQHLSRMSEGEIILAFKAGKAVRRGSTNFVDASPIKGAVILTKGEDELLHFIWKNRETNDVEEDLILFPSDATFTKVSQSSGRVYVLKFSSSDQRHFFWMQDASPGRDDEFANNVNGYLQDTDYEPTWDSSTGASTSTSAQPTSSQGAGTSNFQASPENIAQLGQILSNRLAGQGSSSAALPDLSLTDILTPANITPLFTSHPELIKTLFPHLPPDLPIPPSQETVQQIINSPQFRAAVSNFDQALRTGLLGGLVRGLGLPEEAGLGIEPFLKAIQEQAENERREESMDTD
ncbi:hypothetical protein E1B28_012501 [Marasmius oreades]|uniref:Adhesion regulating molecule n=1 Tax=Marasmius oreades TaxID=181124 RepID=A0A9P7UNB0_9AGAR|nr:uncharacterized protein E1B28_012501 [Marasmius oreades]KAG7088517.1 hypothetical protein E1B28_012501 [Marasmius oreades]